MNDEMRAEVAQRIRRLQEELERRGECSGTDYVVLRGSSGESVAVFDEHDQEVRNRVREILENSDVCDIVVTHLHVEAGEGEPTVVDWETPPRNQHAVPSLSLNYDAQIAKIAANSHQRAARRIVLPPATLELRVGRLLLSRKAFNEVLKPSIDDMRLEVWEALQEGDTVRAKAIVVRWRLTILKVIFMSVPMGWIRRLVLGG